MEIYFLCDFLALGLKADLDADKSAELQLKCLFLCACHAFAVE
jgi:hypothetical protein